jgi:hypothetical protein
MDGGAPLNRRLRGALDLGSEDGGFLRFSVVFEEPGIVFKDPGHFRIFSEVFASDVRRRNFTEVPTIAA